MKHNALKDLYIDELKDIYDAESRLVKALPKLAKAATSGELRSGFEAHLEQTRGHVERLEEIFNGLDEKPTGKKCNAMAGLVKEGEETMDEDFEGEVMDAALIAAAQRVEHYEIAAYGTVCEFAKVLGEMKHASLLEKTLEEESQTDQKLTKLAKKINAQANEDTSSQEDEEDSAKPGRRSPKHAA